jgi:cell division septation protein DedD
MLSSEKLNQRQWVVLFIAGVTLCFIFFAFGFYLGKWSTSQSMTTLAAGVPGSLLPTGSEATATTPVGDQAAAPNANEPAGSTSPPPVAGDSSASSSGAPPSGGIAAEPAPPSGQTNPSQELPSEPSPQGQTTGEPNLFYVRVGIFDKTQEAEDLAALLRSRGFVSAYKADVTEGGTRRYQVLLGPWVDRDSAARTMNELRNEGVSNVSIVNQR